MLRLRVSTEVEPGVFDESVLEAIGARVVHRVHKGWLSLELEADRLPDLRHQRGVVDTLTVVACDDHADQLAADLDWRGLASGDCHGLIDFRIEAGVGAAGAVALRQTAIAKTKCFLRSHRTTAMDLVLWVPDARVPGGRRVVARHSDGLRDRSVAGMHDWKADQTQTITMWVGHLPAGDYGVVGGVDGTVRVQTKLLPYVLEARVRLGGTAEVAAQASASARPLLGSPLSPKGT